MHQNIDECEVFFFCFKIVSNELCIWMYVRVSQVVRLSQQSHFFFSSMLLLIPRAHNLAHDSALFESRFSWFFFFSWLNLSFHFSKLLMCYTEKCFSLSSLVIVSRRVDQFTVVEFFAFLQNLQSSSILIAFVLVCFFFFLGEKKT